MEEENGQQQTSSVFTSGHMKDDNSVRRVEETQYKFYLSCKGLFLTMQTRHDKSHKHESNVHMHFSEIYVIYYLNFCTAVVLTKH